MTVTRLLTYTSLYPNVRQPRHGIFVEQRLRMLLGTGRVSSRVVAPVPWPRRADSVLGARDKASGIPRCETRAGIDVLHPRFLAVPGLGIWTNPMSMALGAMPTIRRLRKAAGDFDIIDAQYFYPDGVAGAILGRLLGKPVVITGRGTDVNVFPTYAVPRAWIRWAACQAAALITVSHALKRSLMDLGIAADRISVLRNGVDLDLFKPGDRNRLRRDLGFNGSTLLSVGNLVPEKGHDLVIGAVALLPQVALVVIGGGPEEKRLRDLAEHHGVGHRVRWVPNLSQSALAEYYSAADATVLASSREGMPNVLLESLACGTRVIATDVGGSVEIVSSPDAGRLVHERSSESIASAVRDLLLVTRNDAATRAYGEQFGWGGPIAEQVELLESIAGRKSIGSLS